MARLNGLIQEELADLLRDLRDPRLASIISITRVDTSADLENSSVYISVLGGDEEKSGSIAALSHAAPFLKRELLHRLRIRKVPALHFILDQSIEEAAHVLELMRKVGGTPPGRKPPSD
jgi:ribosome-binding factor A